jgi:hypothetical protein
MIKLGSLSVLISCIAVTSEAETPILDAANFSGSYFCTSEAVGGVHFDEVINKWTSTNFEPSAQHIVKIEPQSLFKDNIFDEMRTVYTISISAHGKESTSNAYSDYCYTRNDDLRKANPQWNFIYDLGGFNCMVVGGEWSMSLKSMRYLNTYTWGYVDGVDNNDNTPTVEIGKCTKID